MLTFIIDAQDRIGVIDKTETEDTTGGGTRFGSEKELEELAKQWPAARLVKVWNGIPGTAPVRKFSSRQIATARIWKEIQSLAPVTRKPQRKRQKTGPVAEPQRAAEPGNGSKKDEVIALLSTETGGTLQQLMTATGWQKHSIRGFLSGTLKKKMGLKILSSKNAAGERVYRVAE
jgi:hypothetical protein